MRINDHDIDTTITLGDCFAARMRGYDVGNVSSGLLQAIAENPLETLVCAHALLRDRMIAAGIANPQALVNFLSDDDDTRDALVREVRSQLSVFFPVLRAMCQEIEDALTATTTTPSET